ncbi:MAG TPA: YCF48-related protein [Panacibacter sp.]|nr:YCF48-related protein [Panacibacter sp.]HNP43730.1 YCF48-related protein [Panacibacter sp.]
MFNFKKCVFVVLVLCTANSYAQKSVINIVDSGRKTSIRGLSVVDDNIVWISGSNGTVARSVNGGKSFEWQTLAGYEKRDFRDIEAFDENTAVIMAVAEPAVILKTRDGGKSWNKVFEDSTKGMFLDAMDFNSKGEGVVIGDPVNGSMFEAMSVQNGETWYPQLISGMSRNLNKGEAFFAASGSNIKFTGNKDYPLSFVTGGISSRFFYRNKFYALPLLQGKESTGANALALSGNGKMAVIVGGDFAVDTFSTLNCVVVQLKKQPFILVAATPPHGYRSCVEYISNKDLICCGTSGVDISKDGGMNWALVSRLSFHVCKKAKNGSKVFLAGSNGKIAVLDL